MRTRHAARVQAMATWFLDASVLLAIFPVIDQALVPGPFRWGMVAIAELVALTFGMLAVHSTEGAD